MHAHHSIHKVCSGKFLFPPHSVNGLAVHQLLMLQTCGSHPSGNILCGLSMPAAEHLKPHLVPTMPV